MRVFFIGKIICITFVLAGESAVSSKEDDNKFVVENNDSTLKNITFQPQQGPEINNEFEESNHTEVETNNTKHAEANWVIENDDMPLQNVNKTNNSYNSQINDTALQSTETQAANETPGLISTFYIIFKRPIIKFIQTPKVSIVLKNIGTCLVNGAMEIVSYYFPAPLIPLVASAAGMIIPFEPIVMLRNRMPVTSYRRAFNSAMDSFVGTFDRFKTSEEDPYMTRRFNRRFMEGNSKVDGDTNT